MKFIDKFRPQFNRDAFIEVELKNIQSGQSILDAGCGSQRYKSMCGHLSYFAQDFGEYKTDAKKTIGSLGVGGVSGYSYGKIDFLGDIWNVSSADQSFDNILCTEVFEHIPYPNETIAEFSRLLKSGGKLILTFPSNCTRHMDPYYFYTGFSDRWAELILAKFNFKNIQIKPVGDYYRWMFLETYKTFRHASLFGKILVMPSLIYFLFKKSSPESINTLCIGYHIVAIKK